MDGTLHLKHSTVPGLWNERRAVLEGDTLRLTSVPGSILGSFVMDKKASVAGGVVSQVQMISGDRGNGKRPHRFDVTFAPNRGPTPTPAHTLCLHAESSAQLQAWLEALHAVAAVHPVPAAHGPQERTSAWSPPTTPLRQDSAHMSDKAGAGAAAAAMAAAAPGGAGEAGSAGGNKGAGECNDEEEEEDAPASDFDGPRNCGGLLLVLVCRLLLLAGIALALRCQRRAADAGADACRLLALTVPGLEAELSPWQTAVLPALLGSAIALLRHAHGVLRVARGAHGSANPAATVGDPGGARHHAWGTYRAEAVHLLNREFLYAHLIGAAAELGLGATVYFLAFDGWLAGSNSNRSWRLEAGRPLWAAGLLCALLQWRLLVPPASRSSDGGGCGRGAATFVARALRALLWRGAGLCLVPFLIAQKLDDPSLESWHIVFGPLSASFAVLLLVCPALYLHARCCGGRRGGREYRARYGGRRGGPGLALLALTGALGLGALYALVTRLDGGVAALPWSALSPLVQQSDDVADLLVLGPLALLAIIAAALVRIASRGAARALRARQARARRDEEMQEAGSAADADTGLSLLAASSGAAVTETAVAEPIGTSMV
jgi:hypothetical protein